MMNIAKIAKTVAEVRGWTGGAGGYIRDESGAVMCQGWGTLATALVAAGFITDGGQIHWRKMDLAGSRLTARVRSFVPAKLPASR